MQVTVLIDNDGKDELLCEWGLSFLIDTGDRRILLDFGASDRFARNAAMAILGEGISVERLYG